MRMAHNEPEGMGAFRENRAAGHGEALIVRPELARASHQSVLVRRAATLLAQRSTTAIVSAAVSARWYKRI